MKIVLMVMAVLAITACGLQNTNQPSSLTIINNTTSDFFMVTWFDDDGTAYKFEYINSLQSNTKTVNPGSSPIYFKFYGVSGVLYSTVANVRVKTGERKSYTIDGQTLIR